MTHFPFIGELFSGEVIEVSFASIMIGLHGIRTRVVYSRKLMDSVYKSGGCFIFDKQDGDAAVSPRTLAAVQD